jgi:hypothetical protein
VRADIDTEVPIGTWAVAQDFAPKFNVSIKTMLENSNFIGKRLVELWLLCMIDCGHDPASLTLEKEDTPNGAVFRFKISEEGG